METGPPAQAARQAFPALLMVTGPPDQAARQASPALLMVTGAPVRCRLLLLAPSSIMPPSELCFIGAERIMKIHSRPYLRYRYCVQAAVCIQLGRRHSISCSVLPSAVILLSLNSSLWVYTDTTEQPTTMLNM